VTIKERIHKASKPYYCNSCNKIIVTGDNYARLFGAAFPRDKPYELILCMDCAPERLKDQQNEQPKIPSHA